MDKFLPKFDVEKTKKIDNLLSNEINSFAGFEKLSAEEKIDREKALISNIDDFIFDASRHQISAKAISYGKKLLIELNAHEWLNAIRSGKIVNLTENKKALHSALRAPQNSFFSKVILDEVIAQRKKLFNVAERIRSGELKSASGKKYSSILAIGIGGSDLGPRMTVKALQPYADNFDIRFVSNIDPSELINEIRNLNPENTLVIISSKTFTTLETLSNAESAFKWMANSIGENDAKKQRIAITSNIENAKNFGFVDDQILIFSDWVGGRTSIWSSVGLPLAICIGEKRFREFLDGGFLIDKHMIEKGVHSIPSMMAILGYIQRNHIGVSSQAVIPYDSNLSLLPSYLQQLEMESNGKSVSIDGNAINTSSVPVIWGTVGTDAQHSFFQMLHQGTDKIPVDIMVAKKSVYDDESFNIAKRHRILVANALAQAEALFKGRKSKIPHKNFHGGRSVSLFSYNEMTPFRLGSIIAIYEYKVIMQAAFWRINPFDQFGVELGKDFANALLNGNEKNVGLNPEILEQFLKLNSK